MKRHKLPTVLKFQSEVQILNLTRVTLPSAKSSASGSGSHLPTPRWNTTSSTTSTTKADNDNIDERYKDIQQMISYETDWIKFGHVVGGGGGHQLFIRQMCVFMEYGETAVCERRGVTPIRSSIPDPDHPRGE